MFKVLDEVCQPTRATKYSAMVDLYAREDVVIGAGGTVIVPLGVKIDPGFFIYEIGKIDVSAGGFVSAPDNASEIINNFLKSHFLELHPRSSLRAKGLIIGVGVIDLDYPDEIGLIVHNPISGAKHDSKDRIVKFTGQSKTTPFGDYTINKGDKVAQCTLVEHKGYLMGIESNTERTGGFGSTDKVEL